MIRYKLNPNESKIVIYDDNIKIIKIIYPNNNDIFVDILVSKPEFIKLRIFFEDEIIVGWITTCFDELVVLHNKNEIYDGRFNSDRL